MPSGLQLRCLGVVEESLLIRKWSNRSNQLGMILDTFDSEKTIVVKAKKVVRGFLQKK